jgi:hypothetical protein
MATKKKTKKKSATSKKSASKKSKPVQKKLAKKAAKRAVAPKNAAAKKAKKKNLTKASGGKSSSVRNNKSRTKQEKQPLSFPRDTSLSGEDAGDLQGLSNIESADSESVDELVDEGNAFEAGVIEGVEEAGERPERGVRTREVPADDVPGEYLDED